jgi:hypothetical protein
MKTFRELTLFLALLFMAGLLRAQVNCNYHGLKDTLSKDMLANLRISNHTGVEIHNALDARGYSEDGRMVYRYYVPKMINAPWSGMWSLNPQESQFGKKTLAFTDGNWLVDDLKLSTYIGDLRLSLTLRHPLDTQSIVCRTELTLPVSNGVIDFDQMTDDKTRKATGYFKGLSLDFPEATSRFTPASLHGLELINTSAHTICDDLEIHMKQQGNGREVYGIKLTNICIPPGQHALSAAQIAAASIEDRFEDRDTLRPIQIQYRLSGAGRSNSIRIPTKRHGALTLPTQTYFNPALNLSVDFVSPLDDGPSPPSLSEFTVVEDTEGQILEVIRPNSSNSPDLRPASPFGDRFMSRGLGGLVMYQTVRSEDLSPAQLSTFLSKMGGGFSTVFKTVQRGPFEVVFPTATPSRPVHRRAKPSTMLFAVRYQELIYLFGLSSMGGGPGDDPFDIRKFANSIEINGHRLQFSFPAEGGIWPNDVSVSPGTKTVSLTREAYTERLKTFFFYAKGAKGDRDYEVNLRPGKGQDRLNELLALPYSAVQLDSAVYPAMKREVLGEERFSFKEHSEEGFDAKWGIPEQVYTPGYSLTAQNRSGADWVTTFGIDADGNLAKWASPGVSRTYGKVDKEIRVNGRQVMFYGSMHEGTGVRGFSFSAAQFPNEEVPKEFYRAITLQLNSLEHSVLKTMMHDNEQYDVYRSPLTNGFLFNEKYPGMSLLVTGGKNLYQFTVVGINKQEILNWFRTIKVEGKSLKIEPKGADNYHIWLE